MQYAYLHLTLAKKQPERAKLSGEQFASTNFGKRSKRQHDIEAKAYSITTFVMNPFL